MHTFLKILILSTITTISAAENEVIDAEKLPPVIEPGTEYGKPPSNAIILFDGTDFSQWISASDQDPISWKIEDGYMEVVHKDKKYRYIRTKQEFGDCHLHIEWATPEIVEGKGQFRGNSGIFLMGKYEVQILDSYENTTYPDGQAGAIYAQYPPLFNACRKPGQWQTYDIIFHRPHFDDKGELLKPAFVTVLHNGVVIQAHSEIKGTLVEKDKVQYQPHPDRMPIILQDHGNPVRFRNIWVVQLPEK